MIITDVATIERILVEENYQKQCSFYCCLPLWFTRFVCDLRFYSNSVRHAQTFFCGFRDNTYSPVKSCDE
jgi:hypothetical protein